MPSLAVQMKRYRLPQLVMGRFVAFRSLRAGLLWGLLFGATVASSALAYVAAYTTSASRHALASSFGSNVGLKVLLGDTLHLDTVAGFTVWRSVGLVIIIGAIWALLLSTKTFRGEESAGRWELFLTGRTTARRAAANALTGLCVGLVGVYVPVAVLSSTIGHLAKVQFGVTACLFLAVTMVASAAMFLAFGALASQIMPTRSRAASMCAVLFGAFFVLRAVADTSSNLHWLIYCSPLGWVELLRPLTNSQPVWLLPIAGFICLCAALTLVLAGRRDLGDSILADKDSAPPRLYLLRNAFAVSFRLSIATILGWFVAITALSVLFGSLTKTAGQAFTASKGIEHIVGRLSQQAQVMGSTAFLGIIFFFIMTICLVMVASLLHAIREVEAEGYLDNLVTRSTGRAGWLAGRLTIVIFALAGVITLAVVGGWASSSLQHSGVPFDKLFSAGVNILAPAAFMIGVGVWTFAWLPRATSIVTYGIVVWSFLLEMIGSVGNINHWLLDTSLFHHVAFVPATTIRWSSWWVLLTIGAVSCGLGIRRFVVRDLEAE